MGVWICLVHMKMHFSFKNWLIYELFDNSIVSGICQPCGFEFGFYQEQNMVGKRNKNLWLQFFSLQSSVFKAKIVDEAQNCWTQALTVLCNLKIFKRIYSFFLLVWWSLQRVLCRICFLNKAPGQFFFCLVSFIMYHLFLYFIYFPL
jgi:hypothetical protein